MIFKTGHLEGKPWAHGVDDCYEICRRFYADNFQISLRPYARPDEWWEAGLDLYGKHFRDEGFNLLDCSWRDLRPADAILCAIPGRTPASCAQPNHAAIWLGDGRVLHHLPGRLSVAEKTPLIVRNTMVCFLRHRDVPDLTEQMAEDFDILQLLPAHKRRQIEDMMERADVQQGGAASVLQP